MRDASDLCIILRMAPRKTQFASGHYYHVYNRGANREDVFRSEENFVFCLWRVKEQSIQCNVAVIAYCLMPNHYHFVLRQDEDISIARFIQSVFNSYSKAFNKMWERKGTLFESAFHAINVETDEYLLHLCRYIHLNPVVAGLVQQPEDWAYSNYLEWVGRRKGSLVDRGFVSGYFKTSEDYIRFVNEAPSKHIERMMRPLTFDE